jgi:hypothetical protein
VTKIEILAGVRPAERSRTRRLLNAVEWLEARLLTRNRKHFPMFEDLPDPYGVVSG